MTVAPPDSAASIVGWLAIGAGVALFLWGIKVKGQHWWQRLLPTRWRSMRPKGDPPVAVSPRSPDGTPRLEPTPSDDFERMREDALKVAQRVAEGMHGPLGLTPQDIVKRAAGVTQVTQGSQSPNFGTVHGDVYLGPAPVPERQPERAPAPRPQRDPYSFTGPLRPVPDFPLNKLLARLYKILGPAPEMRTPESQKFIRKVNLEIMDQVVHRKLRLWGRSGDRALEVIMDHECQNGTLDHVRGRLSVPAAYTSDHIYTDLHFSQRQIDAVWPEPLETSNDGRP